MAVLPFTAQESLCFPPQKVIKATNATQKQINLVKLHEQSRKNLEEEIQNYKNEAQKQRKIIYQLEKDRENLINEANDLKQKVGTAFCASGSLLSCSWNCKDYIYISLHAIGRKQINSLQAAYKDFLLSVCIACYCVSGLSEGTSAMAVYSVRNLGFSCVLLLFIGHLGNETKAGV